MTADPLELPFDQYQRYRMVAEVLDGLRARGERFSILDVGGRTGILRSFLRDDRVHLVDLEPSEERGLVLGDGSRLPFKDGAFDAVVAFDTLEHVPVDARTQFVTECARVARRWVALAGPWAAPAVDEAELLLQRFLRDKLGIEHRYLAEHRHLGLPDLAAARGRLEQAGARTLVFGHGSLERWLPLMCLSLWLDHEPALRPLAARVFRYYNATLHASDVAEPVYRHALVAALAGAKLPAPPPHPEPASADRAPASGRAQALFHEVFAELVAFDRGRAEWSEERERLWQVVSTLQADLEGHRGALATERSERTQAGAAVADLRADLDGHRGALAETKTALAVANAALAELQRANERAQHEAAAAREKARHEALAEVRAQQAQHEQTLRAQLEAAARQRDEATREREAVTRDRDGVARERDALRATRAELERDLEGHRAALRTLTTDLEGHKKSLRAAESDLKAHQASLRTLETDLEGHRTALGTAEADLVGHRALVRELRAELERAAARHAEDSRTLAEREKALSILRAEVASRTRALARALGLRRPPE